MVTVKYLKDVDACSRASVEKAMAVIETIDVSLCNWPAEFPYKPEVKLRLCHNGSHLILKWDVREKCTAAKEAGDNCRTWTDSCVEFFFKPEGEEKYYNLEATCIGNILMGWRSGREGAVAATAEALSLIGRFPSLGREPFAERLGDNRWSLILTIPAKAFTHSDIKSFCGMKGRFNAYKCGDELSTPHFLSFAPINTPAPDFHRPEFFTDIEFE